MENKIEKAITEIEDYLEECKFQTFSHDNIIVDKDELLGMLSDLKSKAPEEIKRYQKMLSNKDAILADAKKQADSIIAQAQIQTNELISEHQIMQQAYAQANEIVMIATNQAQEILDKATNDANSIRTGAVAYTDDMLKSIERLLSSTIESSVQRHDSFIKNLQASLDVVTANRIELNPPASEPQQQTAPIDISAVQQASVEQ